MEGLPPPVAKLDPLASVRQLNAVAGTALELIGPASGGEVGAAFVRWPDGHDGVLTQSGAGVAALRQTARILRLARSHGIPCPRYDLIAELPEGAVIVQERLPGGPPKRIDDRLIHAMIALNDRFADVLTDQPEVPPLDLYLDRSGPGFCLHESLRVYDRRTRRLLDWIHAVGRSPAAAMTGGDLVHADFHPGNVLVDEAGNITGIIDWDGIGCGDRRFGLVTLAFDLGWGLRFDSRYRDVTPEAVDAVWQRLNAIEPDLFQVYWAHMSLRLVDWSIRHHPPEVVNHYLDFAMIHVDSGANRHEASAPARSVPPRHMKR